MPVWLLQRANLAPATSVTGLPRAIYLTHKSLLKKGTGTSPGAILGNVISHELGASPLFQQAPSPSHSPSISTNSLRVISALLGTAPPSYCETVRIL